MKDIKYKTIIKENKSNYKFSSRKFGGLIWLVFDLLTAMIGYTIHHSIFYSIINFIFSPLAWCYWLITHNVDMTVIRETFSWFFN